jgi:hypothetical protein
MRSTEVGISTMSSRAAKRLAWGILCLCTAACIFGLWALPNSVLGFVVVFGGGLLAYESIVVIRAIVVKERIASRSASATKHPPFTLAA